MTPLQARLVPKSKTVPTRREGRRKGLRYQLVQWVLTAVLAPGLIFAGCDSGTTKPSAEAAKKTAEPVIPQEVQDAADTLLGSETQVLLYGDLAKRTSYLIRRRARLPARW